MKVLLHDLSEQNLPLPAKSEKDFVIFNTNGAFA